MEYRIYNTEKPISKELFEDIYELLSKSLPQIEMRTKAEQEKLLQNHRYNILVALKNNKLVSFISLWCFEEFTFAEHFAVEPDERGNGIGSDMLKYCKSHFLCPIVLEVELPDSSPIAKRRVGFYMRNEFLFNDYEYFQPPMQTGMPNLPLKVLSYPDKLAEDSFSSIRDTLYKTVYNFSNNS